MATRIATLKDTNAGRTVAVVGDLYRFLATGKETDGKYAQFEATVFPGGGPPPHIHRREEEGFFILEGEITFQIDAWSRAVGFPEVKRIAEQVRRALTDSDLELTDNAMLSLEHSQTRMMRDPDGLTNHAAVVFTAFVEQP